MSNMLNLDVNKKLNTNPIVFGRVGDNDSHTERVSVVNDDNTPFDLTGLTITFMGNTSGNKSKVLDTSGVKVIDTVGGIFDYTFPGEAFGVAGSYERAYFAFEDSNGVVSSTADFDIIVYEGADLNAQEAADFISAYNELIAELKELQNTSLSEILASLDGIEGQYTDQLANAKTALTTALNNLSTAETDFQTSLTDLTTKSNDEIADAISDGKTSLQSTIDGFTTQFQDYLTSLGTQWDSISGTLEDQVNDLKQQVLLAISMQGTLQEQMNDMIANGAMTQAQADERYVQQGGVGGELVKELQIDADVIVDTFTAVATDAAVTFEQSTSDYGPTLSLPDNDSAWTTFLSSQLTRATSKDGTYLTVSNSTATYITQMLFKVNVLSLITENLGSDYFTKQGLTATTDQVAHAITNFKYTAFSTGRGSGNGGNQFSIALFNNASSVYDMTVSHTQTALADLEIDIADLTNYISTTGEVDIIVYSLPALSTGTPSQLSLDYVALQVVQTGNLREEFLDVIGFDIDISNWTTLTLNSGFKSYTGRSVRYRQTTYNLAGVLKTYVEFSGAVAPSTGTFASSTTASTIATMAAGARLRPSRLITMVANAGLANAFAKVEMDVSGNLKVTQTTGSAVSYIVLDGFGYWID